MPILSFSCLRHVLELRCHPSILGNFFSGSASVTAVADRIAPSTLALCRYGTVDPEGDRLVFE